MHRLQVMTRKMQKGYIKGESSVKEMKGDESLNFGSDMYVILKSVKNGEVREIWTQQEIQKRYFSAILHKEYRVITNTCFDHHPRRRYT